MEEMDSSLRHFFADFFGWLGHACVELRIIDTASGRVVLQEYITDPELFADKCMEYNGKAQVYFGIQERDGKGGKYENVPALTFIPIDVDAARPDKKTEPADEAQRLNAKGNVAKILKHLQSHGIKPSLVVDTGNGYLILVRIPRQDTSPHFYKAGDSTQNRLSDMVNYFLQHEIKSLCDDTVEIDSVGDLPRILGVPGTINMKSPRDKLRVRTVIMGDIKQAPEPQHALWKLIEDCWESRETKKTETVVTLPRDVDALMAMLPPSLREGYEKPAVGERSDALVRTLLHLANNHGLTKQECVAAMELLTNKIGRERWPAAQQYDKLLAEGKIRPRTFSLGEYTVRVKKDLALIYRGDEPIYPVKIRDLSSASARKSLAKSLGVDVETVHSVAAKLLEICVAEPESAEKEEEKPEIPKEIEAKALEVLTSQDPIEWVADTIQLIHYGDRGKSKVVWVATLTPGLGYELNLVTVGTTGIGKSDLIYAVLCAVPDQYVVRLKECSPKAVYYAVKAGVELNRAVIYFDDVPDTPDVIKLLKDIASENRTDPRLWSVSTEREFLDVELKGDFAVFASAVSTLTDEGDQIVRRYLVLNPDENPEVNKAVLEKIKADMRLGRGKRWLPPEFEVAKEVTRQIKETDYRVLIPFDFEYPDYGPMARSELKQFIGSVWAVTKSRFKQRLTLGKDLLAQLEDFETACQLWGERQPGKVDEVALKILELLVDQEPQEEYDEKGRILYYSPQPVTSTTIAKQMKGKPQRIREKLDHLYNMGYVDRKAVKGRGNPYAYWKSPAYSAIYQTAKSLSPIHLKDPVSEALDYFGRNKSQYSGQNPNAQTTIAEYIERLKKYFATLCLKSPEIIVKPKTAFSTETGEEDFAKLGMAKLSGFVPEPRTTEEKLPDIAEPMPETKQKPEDTPHSEALPRGLRVPPSLEDYMEVLRLEKEWAVQCRLCAKKAKRFYTANVGDMILHIQGWHGELLGFQPGSLGEEKQSWGE